MSYEYIREKSYLLTTTATPFDGWLSFPNYYKIIDYFLQYNLHCIFIHTLVDISLFYTLFISGNLSKSKISNLKWYKQCFIKHKQQFHCCFKYKLILESQHCYKNVVIYFWLSLSLMEMSSKLYPFTLVFSFAFQFHIEVLLFNFSQMRVH